MSYGQINTSTDRMSKPLGEDGQSPAIRKPGLYDLESGQPRVAMGGTSTNQARGEFEDSYMRLVHDLRGGQR